MRLRATRFSRGARRRACVGIAVVAFGIAVASCSSGGDSAALPPSTTTTTTVPLASRLCNGGRPQQTGTLQGDDLRELSGLAASRMHPGIFWAHNDSGDTPRIFAIDRTGARHATTAVNVPQAIDWEDIAIADKTIFVGDIGDNTRSRASIVVFRITEPALSATAVSADSLVLHYPDGAHDAETLMVDPIERQLVIVTKELDGRSGVYTTPLATPGTLTKVATLSLGVLQLATAGDISARGAAVVIRTYQTVFVWSRRGGERLGATLSREPCTLRAPLERQGEALALLPDGGGFVTSSEGVGAPVHVVDAGTTAPPPTSSTAAAPTSTAAG
jgi:hypothetical protein